MNPQRLRRTALALVVIAGTATFPRAAERRPMTEKDLFKFVWVADPQISPDGTHVAFVRVSVDEKTDQYRFDDLDRKERRQRAGATPHRRDARQHAAMGRRQLEACVRARRRKGRPHAAAADLCDGHGRRRRTRDHRNPARRRQPRMESRWQIDSVFGQRIP